MGLNKARNEASNDSVDGWLETFRIHLLCSDTVSCSKHIFHFYLFGPS